MKKLLLLLLCAPLIFNSCKQEGCTDFFADNYDINANSDDGSCEYLGCIDPNADHYDVDANVDDGSCTYTLHIPSVVSSPTESERVTLRNNSGSLVNISNYTIGDLNSPNEYNIPNGTSLNQGEFITYYASTMGFGINNTNETIYFKNSQGVTISTWSN